MRASHTVKANEKEIPLTGTAFVMDAVPDFFQFNETSFWIELV